MTQPHRVWASKNIEKTLKKRIMISNNGCLVQWQCPRKFLLKPQTVQRGRLTCLLSVTPVINVTISTLCFSSLILNLRTVWMLTLLVSRSLPIKDKREEMFLSFTLLAWFVWLLRKWSNIKKLSFSYLFQLIGIWATDVEL